MTGLDIKGYIVSQVKAVLGDPVLEALDTDLNAIDTAISLATYEFFKTFPFTFIETGRYSFYGVSEVKKPISYVLSAAASYSNISDELASKMYYLGITRIESYNENELYNNQGLDSYLLGFPIKQAILPNDYQKYLLNKTQLNIVQGSIEARIDWIGDQIVYIFPYTLMSYSVYHGIGFDDPTLSTIPKDKVHILAKMVVSKFLDMIITARSGIELQGDYSIKLEYLVDIKKKYEEELDKLLSNNSVFPILIS